MEMEGAMTREHAKQLLPIITAYAEGKIIEYKSLLGTWYVIGDNVSFGCLPHDYRIKPEPREFELVRTNCSGQLHKDWEVRGSCCGPILELIKVREIL